jgi:hypothetical protein
MNESVVNNKTETQQRRAPSESPRRIATSPTIATSPLLTRRWHERANAASSFPQNGV